MSRARILSIWVSLLVLTGVTVLAPAAHAGPPLICWPFDIGHAKSLPWASTGRWNSPKTDYNVASLSKDTLALLTPNTPVIVRMETLRRATIYASKDPRIADQLLSLLQTRAVDAEAKGRPDALAWFDAGYLVEAYKQKGLADLAAIDSHRHLASTLDGYAWVKKAIELRGGDAEMEFAAALITADRARQAEREAHWRKAVAGASDGSPLATNLVTHCQMFGLRATAMAELRAQSGSPRE